MSFFDGGDTYINLCGTCGATYKHVFHACTGNRKNVDTIVEFMVHGSIDV